jgi:hypothetical protein
VLKQLDAIGWVKDDRITPPGVAHGLIRMTCRLESWNGLERGVAMRRVSEWGPKRKVDFIGKGVNNMSSASEYRP